jgi:hypothetical protein
MIQEKRAPSRKASAAATAAGRSATARDHHAAVTHMDDNAGRP